MAYAVEAQHVKEWLLQHVHTARKRETIHLADVLNYMHSYRSAIDSQVLARLRRIPGCTIRSDSPQYLPLSHKLSEGAESGYAFSMQSEPGSRLGYKVYGYQWMIIYCGNAYKIQLFATTNRDSSIAGVEVHAGVADGKSHNDLIVQMCSAEETQTAITQIQGALQSWMLRIRQETPADIAHTDAAFG